MPEIGHSDGSGSVTAIVIGKRLRLDKRRKSLHRRIQWNWDIDTHGRRSRDERPWQESGSPVANPGTIRHQRALLPLHGYGSAWTNNGILIVGYGSMSTGVLKGLLGPGQSVLGAWNFSVTGNGYATKTIRPISHLGSSAGYNRNGLQVWHYDGSQWTTYAASDLTYDGDWASLAGWTGSAATR